MGSKTMNSPSDCYAKYVWGSVDGEKLEATDRSFGRKN